MATPTALPFGRPGDNPNVQLIGTISQNKNMKFVQSVESGQPFPGAIATSRKQKSLKKSLIDKKSQIQFQKAIEVSPLMDILSIRTHRKKNYARLLHRCALMNDIREGTIVHVHITKMGFHTDPFLANNLITMYVKCGNLMDARLVFDKMPTRNKVSWSAIISGYAENGFADEALVLFYRMRVAGMKPNHYTFVSILQACASLGALNLGRQVHAWAVKKEFAGNVYLGGALLHLYANCRSLEEAIKVFDRMSERNVVSWTAIIAGYAAQGYAHESLDLFHQMRLAGVKPNYFTFPSVLRACTCLRGIKQGEEVHAYAIKLGVESDTFVGSALVDMYVKCGSLTDAHRVFNKITERDWVLWNAMISGSLQWGWCKQALMLLNQMQLAGLEPNDSLVTDVRNLCGSKQFSQKECE